jgi:hypothetical protein
VVNRWPSALLLVVPNLVLIVVALLVPRLDVSRNTRALIIIVTAVVCLAALVFIALWLNRRWQQP